MSEETFEPSMQPFAIYNDGLPNSVYAGLHPEHEIVSHIPDEAIDEIFPASAEDVSWLLLQCGSDSLQCI